MLPASLRVSSLLRMRPRRARGWGWGAAALLRLLVAAATVVMPSCSSPRYVCAIGGDWRGSGANDGRGWFEQHIHGGESCEEFCAARAHAACAGMCGTPDVNDASPSLCDCPAASFVNSTRECERRGVKWKICRCVAGGHDTYAAFPAVDPPSSLHRIFDFLSAARAQMLRRGDVAVALTALESSAIAFFVDSVNGDSSRSRSDGGGSSIFNGSTSVPEALAARASHDGGVVVVSAPFVLSVLRPIDVNGDGLVHDAEFPSVADRLAAVRRGMLALATTERLVRRSRR